MLIGTHALLPVSGCLLADQIALISGRDRFFPQKSFWMIGIFGILPDVCTPHLSLAARYASWSHTVWFMAGMVLLSAMAGTFFDKGRQLAVAVACWLAAALHLAADAVSGGIAWLYPWKADIIGKYYIAPQYWIWSDAFFILFTWLLLRVLPHLEARQIRS